MTNFNILLVEDDLVIAQSIVSEFSKLGMPVEHVADGEAGLRRGLSQQYAVVLLDIELPGMNGFDICKELRKQKPLLPIMLLTSRTTQIDRILGFELGADDFVSKPFEIQELIARVRSKLRRAIALREQNAAPVSSSNPQMISIGEITIDLARRTCTKNQEVLTLTAKEFDLLAFLMQNPGIVIPKEEILHVVWNVSSLGYEEAVVAVIRRIRRKIEDDPQNPKYITTARSVGYTFADPIILGNSKP